MVSVFWKSGNQTQLRPIPRQPSASGRGFCFARILSFDVAAVGHFTGRQSFSVGHLQLVSSSSSLCLASADRFTSEVPYVQKFHISCEPRLEDSGPSEFWPPGVGSSRTQTCGLASCLIDCALPLQAAALAPKG